MKSTDECWLRARRPAQKAERRDAILETAGELFDAVGYDAVSLNGIARAVGLAKSNLYRYFQSKEEIFLALLEVAHARWVASAQVALEALPAPSSPDTVGEALARTLAAEPRLCALAAIVASVLERNVTEARIAEHKAESIGHLLGLLTSIMRVVPSLGFERATTFFRLAYALLTGLWPVANPPPVVRAVLAQPQFAPMRADFERDLSVGLANLLAGLTRPA